MTNAHGSPGSGPNTNVAYLRPPNQAQPVISPFEPFYASQITGSVIQPRRWLVEGVCMRKTVCLFAGPPKVGKSLALQQVLTAAAAGKDWFGRRTEKVKTFGFFTEDPQDELERRQHDINKHYGIGDADLELDVSWDAREGKDALLVEFEKFSDKPKFPPLWHQLWNYVREEGTQLIGIDTAAVVFGGNENFRGQVTNFMRVLVQQAVKYDAGIILTAHPSKTGANSYSGSTAWLGSARFAMSLGRPKEYDEETGEPRDERVLRSLGANYTVGHHMDKLRWDKGVFVLEPGSNNNRPRRGPLTTQERRDLDYRLLAYLRTLVANGAPPIADEAHEKSLPKRARRGGSYEMQQIPLQEYNDATLRLMNTAQVTRVEYKTNCVLRPADMIIAGEKPWVTP